MSHAKGKDDRCRSGSAHGHQDALVCVLREVVNKDIVGEPGPPHDIEFIFKPTAGFFRLPG
jgi:hypothetical protein